MKAARTNVLSMVEGDPVPKIPPYLMETAGENYCVFQAEGIAVGTDMNEDRPVGLTVLLYVRGRDRLGVGRCVEYKPSAEHARDLAAQLIAFADEVEAAAKDQADAALRKAAGR